MIRFAENLNKMITAGLGGAMEAPSTEVAVGHRVVYKEVSGAVVNFETNRIAPIKKLRVTMEPIQAGSGNPSPENIRPITGRDEVTVERTGVNVLPAKFYDGIPYNGAVGKQLTLTELDDVAKDGNTFTRAVSAAWTGFGMISEALPVGTYRCNVAFTATTPRSTLYVLDGDMKVTRRIGNMSTNGTWAREITLEEGEKYIAVLVALSSTGTVSAVEPQIEVGSTASAYEPFDGDTATIQLGQTVYGGTVDVTAGMMTVEWANIASYDGETLPGEWISDRDAYAPVTTPTTGAQVCYKLATPLTIQLTPAQLTTLKGQNNVWSDAGNISLEYLYYKETEGY